MGAKTGMYAVRQPLKYLEKNQRKVEGDYAYTVDASQSGGIKIANTIDANYFKGVNANRGHASSRRAIWDEARIRRLTPRECERLQGFPDDWTRYDRDMMEVSDTQRYKMMGNAVTTNVVKAIGERLVKCGNMH